MKTSLIVVMLAAACGKSPPAAPLSPSSPVAPGSGTTAASTAELGPNDVTMIWPMPANEAQRDSLLSASSVGAYGELLPDRVYAVPVLDERDATTTDPHADRARLRVVAARFEPCRASFGSAEDPDCVNQLRLVLQVLRPGGGSSGTTMGANDGAVLVFYKLTRDELLGFARDVAALRDKHGGDKVEVLGVHPLLAREGLGSEYAKALQAKILEHAGADRLTRITFFMRTRAREPEWVFGAFDVKDGKAVTRPIATLGAERQTLEGAGPMKVIKPATTAKDNPGALLAVFGRREATQADRAAYAAVLRIENPTRHTPETMACAECHAAERMHATGVALGLSPEQFAADYYVPVVTSATVGKISGENFHAVSYLGTNLAVSTRTANDTSVVLAEMRTLLH
ncbi:MAG TPA: hypothetical protein VIV40_04065 [Kofleriaceae bacterium]